MTVMRRTTPAVIVLTLFGASTGCGADVELASTEVDASELFLGTVFGVGLVAESDVLGIPDASKLMPSEFFDDYQTLAVETTEAIAFENPDFLADFERTMRGGDLEAMMAMLTAGREVVMKRLKPAAEAKAESTLSEEAPKHVQEVVDDETRFLTWAIPVAVYIVAAVYDKVAVFEDYYWPKREGEGGLRDEVLVANLASALAPREDLMQGAHAAK